MASPHRPEVATHHAFSAFSATPSVAANRARSAAQPPWLYVSQFLLGPNHAEHLSDWRRITAGGAFHLTIHPDLTCTQVRRSDRELTLLGHLLDPRAPDDGNAEILQWLLAQFERRSALLQATSALGGRWLLIAAKADDVFLFHDALGLRQVFYTDPRVAGALWAMSQPGLAREAGLALAPDPAALDYIDTQTFRQSREYRWPAAASTFVGLNHLLPNHWLDLRTGIARRYWPSAALEALTPQAAVERLAILMPGQIRAAARRFDLALSLTAGMDSRAVLAAARPIINRIRIVTVRQGRLTDEHADVTVPARLLARLRLRHDVIRATSLMTPEFSLHYKRNVHLAHDHYGHDAEAILRHYGRNGAALTGSGAEVGRRPFRVKLPHADRVRFTPEMLAWLEYGSTHPFLVASFAEWLDDVGRQRHVKLLDLFEWEQDYGNWLAMVQLEFDTAWRDIFTPYNCREVLAAMLGVPERYRRPRDGILWRMFIGQMWPELLSEPINPHRRIGRIDQAILNLKALRRYWGFKRREGGWRPTT